jgi:chaperonin GroES
MHAEMYGADGMDMMAGMDADIYAMTGDEAMEGEAMPNEGESVDIEAAMTQLQRLRAFIQSQNLAAEIDEDVLQKIGQECGRGYDIDKASRADWEKLTKSAMDLAMQVAEEKSWPWQKAANVKFPLITTAAVQFAARAYPAIVQSPAIVKGKVNGPDPDGTKLDRANRVASHMSYQLMEEMEEWEEDTDRLLLMTAIVGCSFRKTYFDSTLGRNVSELVPAKHVVFNHAVAWRKLRRVTQELFLYKNDVIERVRSGTFREIELGLPDGEDSDEDGAFEFRECHCWYDLDEDGYKEPYIVTYKADTHEVVRIVARFDEEGVQVNNSAQVARIAPTGYWTKYPFLPNPDGGSYDIGLGVLLNPINETINTVINQLLDAGTLANTGGGFIGKGLRLKSGPMRFSPGEYKPVDAQGAAIRDNIVPLTFPGPSPVLFQLLGMLIDAGRDVASVKDVLTGEQSQSNVPATTTLALIEQGLKVFTAIYKRIHRALGHELKLLYRLNKLYLQPEVYFQFHDSQQTVTLEDYRGDSTDISPVSDPHLVTDAQELAKAQALMGFSGDPLFNQMELRKRFLKAIKEENPEQLLQEPQQPPPDPKMVEAMEKLKIQAAEAGAKVEKMHAEIDKIKAEGIKTLAEAEAQEIGNQMQQYMHQFANIEAMLKQHMEMMGNGAERVRGMEAPPDDQGVSAVPAGLPSMDAGQMGGGGVYQPDAGGVGDAQPGGGGESPVLPGLGDAGI